MDLSEFIPDAYDRAARLQPALVTLLAPAVTLFVWAPASYETAGVIASVIATFGGLHLLMHQARAAGRRIQRQLYSQWGGQPTTLWLRATSQKLAPPTRQRYLEKLSALVTTFSIPDPNLEDATPSANDLLYTAAVDWLRATMKLHSDKSTAIDRENRSYGFRRNLRGLKPLGLTIALGTLLANIILIMNQIPTPDLLLAYGSAAVSGIVTMAFCCIVTDNWVRDAADAYAQALLESCDLL